MHHIDFDKRFTLLTQEAHLTKNTLLSGFDLLIKANFFQDKDGYFYSGFFHISIGIERILKLALITHYMLSNNYQPPTIEQSKKLKKDFGHKINKLYSECQELITQYPDSLVPQSPKTINDDALIAFFTEYAIGSRYFNLDELCEAKKDNPLDKWLDLARAIYEEYIPNQVREKSGLNLMDKMSTSGFTKYLDTQGYLMTEFDCHHTQYIIEKSSPLVIWRIIEILRPIYFLLKKMTDKATHYEVENNIRLMVIPYYEEFFHFLLMDKASIRKKKNWLKNL